MTPYFDKSALRIHFLRARAELNADYRQASTQAIAQMLPDYCPPHAIIAGYAAIRGELDVFPALAVLAQRGHTLCLPVIAAPGQALHFRRWQPDDALIKGTHGIAVPAESAELIVPDVILVPLLAFDAQRHRLGYGAGYYDRTIARLKKINKNMRCIGIGYAMQHAQMLPVAAHDERLDEVITESGQWPVVSDE